MPRDTKGRFTPKDYDNNMIVTLPSFFSMLKVIIFAIIIYPWYYIATRKNFLTGFFESLFYGNPISVSASDSSPPPKQPFN